MPNITRLVPTIIVLLVGAGCSTSALGPSQAQPVVPPVAPATCTPLPPGLKFYGGVALSEVEKAGLFPMQHPDRRYLKTMSSPVWSRFKVGLLPTDLVYEYYHDERWEGGGMHHGGFAAFRGNCTIKIEQVWTT